MRTSLFRPWIYKKVTKLCQNKGDFNVAMTMGKALNKAGQARGGVDTGYWILHTG